MKLLLILVSCNCVFAQDPEHFEELNPKNFNYINCQGVLKKTCEWAKNPLPRYALGGEKNKHQVIAYYFDRFEYYLSTFDTVVYDKVLEANAKRKPVPSQNIEIYDRYIHLMAYKYGLDPDLIKSVIKAESRWDPLAVSRKGAEGLMQLMPSLSEEAVINPFDPYSNIEVGTKYLAKLLKVHRNDVKLALAAYNAGPKKVKEWGGVPKYRETTEYIKSVLAYYKSYKKEKNISRRYGV